MGLVPISNSEFVAINTLLYADESTLHPTGLNSIWNPDNIYAAMNQPDKSNGEIPKGPAVGSLLQNADTEALRSRGAESDKEFTRADEWANAIEMARDPEGNIASLRLVDVHQDPSGSLAVTLQSGSETYVFFKGTGGGEWEDNLLGAWNSDTPAQLDAAAYVRYVRERYAKDGTLTVSGHSKGANKAMYATITTGVVDECVAFDGQGFSDEFQAAYAGEIVAVRGRITAINVNNDFISSTLEAVVGTVMWVQGQRVGEFDPKNHSMGSFLTDDKAMTYVSGPGPAHRLVRAVAAELLGRLSDENVTLLTGYLGVLVDCLLGDLKESEGMSLDQALDYADELYPGGKDLLLSSVLSLSSVQALLACFALGGSRLAAGLMAHSVAGWFKVTGSTRGADGTELAQRIDSSLVRDFSEEKERELVAAMEELSDMSMVGMGSWEGYGTESLGGLEIESHRGGIDGEITTMVELGEARIRAVRSMFAEAREADASYAGRLSGIAGALGAARASVAAVA